MFDAGSSSTNGRTYLALPSTRNPRWLLPLSSRRCLWRGLDLYTPYRTLGHVKKQLLRLAATAACAGLPVKKIRIPFDELEKLVRDILGVKEVVLAFSFGTPGKYRKATVQVMHLDGVVAGYLKLPLTEAALERVRRECATLETLARCPKLRNRIPRLLHAGWSGQTYVLFQTGLPGKPGSTRFGVHHQTFLEGLSQARRTVKMGDAVVGLVASEVRDTLPRMGTEWQQLGVEMLEWADQWLTGRFVECGITHGDFAPWNTREDGHLFCFDWESARTDVPCCWDEFHFQTQVSALLKTSTTLDLDSPTRPALYGLYLLSSACKLHEEGGEVQRGIDFRRQRVQQLLLEMPWTPVRRHSRVAA